MVAPLKIFYNNFAFRCLSNPGLYWSEIGFRARKSIHPVLWMCGKVVVTSHQTYAGPGTEQQLVRPPLESWGATESVCYHCSIRQISAGRAKQHIPQALPMRVTQPHTPWNNTHTKNESETVEWRGTDRRPWGIYHLLLTPSFSWCLICMSMSLCQCF